MAHDKDYKERLIAVVKKEVKQVMEESVTRKFVHEESGSVTSLCGAVEACLSQGLKRRALGLFKTSSTTALLHKIAKHSQEAAQISQRLHDLEKSDPTATNRRSSSSSDSLTKPHLRKHASLSSVIAAVNQPLPKYLWIRLALFEKQLAKIIEYLVRNASRYYEKEALVADPDYGSILSSLGVVGGCGGGAHSTTPPSSRRGLAPKTSRRPPIQPNIRRSLNGSGGGGSGSCGEDMAGGGGGGGRSPALEYVESLHQNSRAALLFGKNNVTRILGVRPTRTTGRDRVRALSSGERHRGHCHPGRTGRRTAPAHTFPQRHVCIYHFHKNIIKGRSFPRGHMLAFLSCLETGLLPRGRLDPPLWSHRSGGRTTTTTTTANGKRQRRPLPALAADANGDPETSNAPIATRDYVFRIIDSSDHPDMRGTGAKTRAQLASTSTSSDSSCKSFSIDQQHVSIAAASTVLTMICVCLDGGDCIRAVCDSMKRQIISRAFYGWLAYCRHLSTVRTHLSGLNTMSEWLAVEAIVRQRDKENQAQAHAKLSTGSAASEQPPDQPPDPLQAHLSNEQPILIKLLGELVASKSKLTKIKFNTLSSCFPESICDDVSELVNDTTEVYQEEPVFSSNKDCYPEEMKDFVHNVIVTNASVDMSNLGYSVKNPLICFNSTWSHRVCIYNCSNCITGKEECGGGGALGGGVGRSNLDAVTEENNSSLDTCIETHGLASPAPSACPSPASSNGGVYTQELLETFGLNLHRIEKDVQRCDRNYWYFTEKENLDKLRNVMCTYVWEHLEIGYMQGMCDLVAPLLVIFNEESMTYACFCHLMERMVENFPNGQQMDCHFANMRSLIQILDAEMYELMHQHGDYTHFYFCYRWFLLDFKRELVYADVNAAWEVIWAAQQVASQHFVLFIALALLETYQMAERHDAKSVLRLARELVLQLQLLIENK
nr:unnamed protein product [Callosobruchus analis]